MNFRHPTLSGDVYGQMGEKLLKDVGAQNECLRVLPSSNSLVCGGISMKGGQKSEQIQRTIRIDKTPGKDAAGRQRSE